MITHAKYFTVTTVFSLLLVTFVSSQAVTMSAEMHTLRGAIPDDTPGYDVRASGELIVRDPFKMKMTECIFKAFKTQIVWRRYPVGRLPFLLNASEVDLIYPMSITDERNASMMPTRSTWENRDYLLSIKPVDMNNKKTRVIARLNSPQHVDAIKDAYVAIYTPPTFEQMIQMLILNHGDVAIIPATVFTENKDTWPKEIIAIQGKNRATAFYLDKNDSKDLAPRLNASIEQCRKK